MEKIKLQLQVSLEPEVAIAIRRYLGSVPADQVGLQNIVALENALMDALSRQTSGDGKKAFLPPLAEEIEKPVNTKTNAKL